MAEGNALDGFVPSSLEDIKLSEDVGAQENLIKDVAGVVFIAVILTFFLAMLSFPEAQLKAQEELDRPSLPYVSALIKEVQRAILNDEKMYPNPRAFMPERFLKNGELDPSILDPADVGFGFGRRICPGSHIALSNIWISLASILATFTISKARDEDGVVIEPSMKYRSGQPEPFKCTITPRYSKAGELIHNYVSNFE
ncbi:cytochrome P450 [Pholiota molesta]|nr:cytochrome P450 [Pholiota molesta]